MPKECRRLIDVCLLTQNLIKDDIITYDRTKYAKQAWAIINKAAEIIDRYQSKAYMNYVFTTIKRCNPTQPKLYGRVKRINVKVNETLQKISDHCSFKSRVTWGTTRSSYISKIIDEVFSSASSRRNCRKFITNQLSTLLHKLRQRENQGEDEWYLLVRYDFTLKILRFTVTLQNKQINIP